jgi:cytoskeletal protein RodZ
MQAATPAVATPAPAAPAVVPTVAQTAAPAVATPAPSAESAAQAPATVAETESTKGVSIEIDDEIEAVLAQAKLKSEKSRKAAATTKRIRRIALAVVITLLVGELGFLAISNLSGRRA